MTGQMTIRMRRGFVCLRVGTLLDKAEELTNRWDYQCTGAALEKVRRALSRYEQNSVIQQDFSEYAGTINRFHNEIECIGSELSRRVINK